jgi:geranylgeranyl diphosphate synthase type II
MPTPLFPADNTSRIEAYIDDYFAAATERAKAISPAYETLWQTLHNLMRAGGKRFRPNMVLLAYELFGGSEPDGMLPIAVAQEFLHFSLLIHDDIIDRDYVRYGQENVSGRYRDIYKQYVSNEADINHYAASAAIMGGDLMLSAAHEQIAISAVSASHKANAQSLLSEGIFNVAAGELLDTEAVFAPHNDGDAMTIAKHKTASYSFVTPLLTGATLAGATEKQCEHLRCYAQSLGVAYQLHDDIIGVFGDEAQTGKSTTGDIREGKRTLLVEYALHAMTDEQTVSFRRAFGNANATDEDLHIAKQLLEASGARHKVEADITEQRQEALHEAKLMGLSAENEARLAALAKKVTGWSS